MDRDGERHQLLYQDGLWDVEEKSVYVVIGPPLGPPSLGAARRIRFNVFGFDLPIERRTDGLILRESCASRSWPKQACRHLAYRLWLT